MKKSRKDFDARWMCPLWGPELTEGCPEVFLSIDLGMAFRLARTAWPTANGWRSLGRQDPNDPEVCLPVRPSEDFEQVVMVQKSTRRRLGRRR